MIFLFPNQTYVQTDGSDIIYNFTLKSFVNLNLRYMCSGNLTLNQFFIETSDFFSGFLQTIYDFNRVCIFESIFVKGKKREYLNNFLFYIFTGNNRGVST